MPSQETWAPYFPAVTNLCIAYYKEHSGSSRDSACIAELLLRAMDLEGLPTHCPVHHYMVPATLLTICRLKQNCSLPVIMQDLETALGRAKNVLPGFCGYYGCCGAGVGIGIFWSVITGSTPYSAETWGLLNRATGQALLDIGQFSGPRCCKRTSFTAVQSALPQINARLRLNLSANFCGFCNYSAVNKECLRANCPYYSL